MLSIDTLEALSTPANFDTWNWAIWLISMWGCIGSDMVGGGGGEWVTDRVPWRLRPVPCSDTWSL